MYHGCIKTKECARSAIYRHPAAACRKLGYVVTVNHATTERCPSCPTEVQWNEPVCPRCGVNLDPPNVRYARLHRVDLLVRATAARAASAGGAAALGVAAAASKATVSMPPAVARQLLTKTSTLYQAYRGMVLGGGRRPAEPKDDQMRTAVEGRLYGTHGVGSVRYGALTLDGRGLRSYCLVCATLHEDAVQRRATVLAGNSYDVIGKRKVKEPVPAGVLSGWEDRAELVVAGSAAGLAANPDNTALTRAVLFTEGKRRTDRFYEVHLWGPFNRDSVAEWRVLAPATDPDDRLDLDIAERLAASSKTPWFRA